MNGEGVNGSLERFVKDWGKAPWGAWEGGIGREQAQRLAVI